MGRYLILIGRRPVGRDPALRAKLERWPCALERDDLLVFADTGLTPFPLGDGLMLGQVFTRGATAPSTSFDLAKQQACMSSEGALLTETCWGDYVALLPVKEKGGWQVLRAPFGTLPCLWASQDGLLWVASDLPLLEQAGLRRPAVDWEALRLHLMQPELRRPATCLAGITDLAGGTRLTVVDAETSVEEIWTPWDFVRRPEVPPDDAPIRLRGAVNICVAAKTAQFGRTLLMLSGGLDSSIAAASLTSAGRDFACLTFRSDGARGDESHYARAVAEHLGRPWQEQRPDPDRVDPTRSASAHLPRPSERMFFQEYDSIACRFAGDIGANAILDGGGGDNLFYGHPAVAAIADCLLTANGRFRASAQALADLTGSSRWRVMAMALRRAWRKRPVSMGGRARFDFLRGHRTELTQLDPWFDPPDDILPGKASHVRLLAPARTLVECADPLRTIPIVSVLMTQPIVETCLAMPTDLWFAPGWNRAIARAAFRAALPATVIERRSKGSPDAFVATLFARNRTPLRELLRDGLLAEHGLIDRDAVVAVLDHPAPPIGYDFARVLEIADAEAWARSRA